MFRRKPIASAKFIWLKVVLMALGFAGIIKVMAWLQEPKADILGLDEPIKARVVIGDDQTARSTSN